MMPRIVIVGWTVACVLGIVAAPAAAAEVQLHFRGITLNANLEFAEGTSAADGIVLITHGLMANHRMELVSTLQALLKERGRSSLAITLGLGRDDRRGMVDCALAHRHRRSDALDEIGAWIAWLKSRGAGPLALLGHSSGGNQAAWYAATRDDPALRAVVLLAPSTWDPGRAAERYRARHGKALADVLERARALADSDRGSAVMENTGFL
ncbi:MAG: alpha/beta fold hydrolase, partial [Alphaproteobacteria bacterium]